MVSSPKKSSFNDFCWSKEKLIVLDWLSFQVGLEQNWTFLPFEKEEEDSSSDKNERTFQEFTLLFSRGNGKEGKREMDSLFDQHLGRFLFRTQKVHIANQKRGLYLRKTFSKSFVYR